VRTHFYKTNLEAKAGKEADVAAFLNAGLGLAHEEQQTPVWFALKLNPSTFAVFDAFEQEAHAGGAMPCPRSRLPTQTSGLRAYYRFVTVRPMGNPISLSTELSLPCGVVLKNRLAKSAMSENMADNKHRPDARLGLLYETWAQGGIGLLISGNVMCDQRALGEPNNVVVEKASADLASLRAWATKGKLNATQFWMQINHPGRQIPNFLAKTPVAPSAIALRPPLDRAFNKPRALEQAEIMEIVMRFADSAELAKQAGFTGVQIHGAHGYLVAQFLSPLSNQRTDQWGGSLENRMRFVIEIYRAIRARVGNKFPIGIKLNSADFQRGGFSEEESLQVIETLSHEGMDLVEISGGSYEAPVMMEGDRKASTKAREAYFLDFAAKARKHCKAPLMVTGGFRTAEGMQQALSSGNLDLIGLARSLALDPAFPKKLLANEKTVSQVKPLTTGMSWLDKLVPLEILWYTGQLHRMGRGKAPNPKASVAATVFRMMKDVGWQSLKRVRA
jgi:2,4-dienoyl-CoA reductase-like NADH-dependent reductase (Old Yellow Enzyme family)